MPPSVPSSDRAHARRLPGVGQRHAARVVADEKPPVLVQTSTQLDDILTVCGLETEAFRARLDDGRTCHGCLRDLVLVLEFAFEYQHFLAQFIDTLQQLGRRGIGVRRGEWYGCRKGCNGCGQRPGDDFICTPHLLMFGSCKISSAKLRSQSRRGDKTVCSATVRRTPCVQKQRAFICCCRSGRRFRLRQNAAPAPSASRRNPRSWPSVSSESARRSVQR